MNLPFEIILKIIFLSDDTVLNNLKNNYYFLDFNNDIQKEINKRTEINWKITYFQNLTNVKKKLILHFKDKFFFDNFYSGEFRQIINLRMNIAVFYENLFNNWWDKNIEKKLILKEFRMESILIKIKKKLKEFNIRYNTNYFNFPNSKFTFQL